MSLPTDAADDEDFGLSTNLKENSKLKLDHDASNPEDLVDSCNTSVLQSAMANKYNSGFKSPSCRSPRNHVRTPKKSKRKKEQQFESFGKKPAAQANGRTHINVSTGYSPDMPLAENSNGSIDVKMTVSHRQPAPVISILHQYQQNVKGEAPAYMTSCIQMGRDSKNQSQTPRSIKLKGRIYKQKEKDPKTIVYNLARGGLTA